MGGAKALMMEQEHNLGLAASYLVREGILEECEFHGEIYSPDFFELESDFWRKAMADRNKGDNGPIPWALEMQAREFTDIIKKAYEEHCGDSCGYCDKNMED